MAMTPAQRQAWFKFLDKYYDVEFADGGPEGIHGKAKCKHCNAVFESETLFALWCHISNKHPELPDMMADLWKTEQAICGSNGAVAAANASDGKPATEENACGASRS